MDFFIPILNTLAIAVAFILLMVGLMSAPWQVLLLILVLGILAYQWLIRQHHLEGVLEDINLNAGANALDAQAKEAHTQPAASNQNRVLQYRGSSYTAFSPSTEAEALSSATVERTGQYRSMMQRFWL